MDMNLKDRMRGCLMGLAVGDALGFGAEFMSKSQVAIHYPDGLKQYKDIVVDRWRKEEHIGHWTDDTDMMLAILDSILENKELKPQSVAEHFIRWVETSPWDMGMLTSDVLNSPSYLSNPMACAKREWENSGRNSAGNGGLMRTAITAVWKYDDWEAIKKNTVDVCRLTHYDPRCVGSCVVLCFMLYKIWRNEICTKRELLELSKEFDERIGKFIEFGYRDNLPMLVLDGPDKGYTLKAMATAIWAYNFAENYFDGIQQIIMEGGDADTNCAIAGPILGAKFGYDSIPTPLIEELKENKVLKDKINSLLDLIHP